MQEKLLDLFWDRMLVLFLVVNLIDYAKFNQVRGTTFLRMVVFLIPQNAVKKIV